MQCIKLIDYIDRPEMITSTIGEVVKRVRHFPENKSSMEILVEFEDGTEEFFYADGRYGQDDLNSWFMLKEPLNRQFEQYEHHGTEVWVDKKLKGKHREHCLCYSCENLDTENLDNNCPIAKDLFKKCLEHKVVIPVFECPKFKEKLK